MNVLPRYASLIFIALLGTACSQPLSFKGGKSETGFNSPTQCQPGETTVSKPTKFLFVVDQSGSNIDGPYEHPGSATDPAKTFRYGVLSDFVQKHGGKSTINWGFITFRSGGIQSLINGFGDTAAVNSALQSFLSATDVGDTPYKAALAQARETIQQDLAKSSVAFQYRIAFLTDGYPTDYCSDPAVVTCPGAVLESNIDADVQSIINLAPSAIQMSTVYYGLPDATASGRLQRMAKVGGGQFVDTNVSRTITLDDVIKVPTTCP